MTALLYRIDPSRNMARWYRLDIERDLFGAYCVTRAWGRVGLRGQSRSEGYASAEAALCSLDKQRLRKEQRGYCPTSLSEERRPATVGH